MARTKAHDPISGEALAGARRAAGLSLQQVATAARLSRSGVASTERLASVGPRRARRYLKAVLMAAGARSEP